MVVLVERLQAATEAVLLKALADMGQKYIKLMPNTPTPAAPAK